MHGSSSAISSPFGIGKCVIRINILEFSVPYPAVISECQLYRDRIYPSSAVLLLEEVNSGFFRGPGLPFLPDLP